MRVSQAEEASVVPQESSRLTNNDGRRSLNLPVRTARRRRGLTRPTVPFPFGPASARLAATGGTVGFRACPRRGPTPGVRRPKDACAGFGEGVLDPVTSYLRAQSLDREPRRPIAPGRWRGARWLLVSGTSRCPRAQCDRSPSPVIVACARLANAGVPQPRYSKLELDSVISSPLTSFVLDLGAAAVELHQRREGT